MSTASAWSVALLGMEGTLVEVEAAIGGGLPRTVLVGLPDTALYEARDRCRGLRALAHPGPVRRPARWTTQCDAAPRRWPPRSQRRSPGHSASRPSAGLRESD